MVLIIAEIYFYFFNPISYLKPPKPLSKQQLGELFVRQSPIPGLDYELAPNKDSKALSISIRTNSYGMRDDEPVISDSDPARRIVVIGDSFTFGYRVGGEDTYPNVLEKILNEQNGRTRFEVLNLGVGGYTTRQEAIALKHKGLKWDPELIIIGYVLNDPEIDSLQPLPAFFNETKWWQHVNIFRLIAKFKQIYDVKMLGGGDYYIYLHKDERKWQSVVSGFESIKNAAKEKNIPVLLIIFPTIDNEGLRVKDGFWDSYKYKDLHNKVENIADENGFYVIDLYDYYSNYPPQDLVSTPTDNHPNELGHRIAGEAILEWILGNESIVRSVSGNDKQ
ncbi:MAG: hypothetical protein DHS20C13_22810 [Thermodesulfobacteriota bacterium]|nr:MAG: hypothetical protein DHS20C13_22810 [Thermodesulfobacteriota bacterium]